MFGRWTRGLSGSYLCGVLIACGGRAQLDLSGAITAAATGGASGAPAIDNAATGSGGVKTTVGDSGSAGAGNGGVPSSVPQGCPDPTQHPLCAGLSVDLDLTGAVSPGVSAVWVEPLQVPNFGMRPPAYVPVDGDQLEPASWDRSAMPAGACVFRLHHASGACLRPGRIAIGSCAHELAADARTPPAVPISFYDSYSNNDHNCAEGIAPGCPSSNPWSQLGFWWYELPHGTDLDIVVCAPLCAGEFGAGACLSLPPVRP